MNPAEDTRNLVDRFKGLENEAVVAELDKTCTSIEIAIENLSHDFNIGTIVRNANAFNVSRVHIIGKRKYNRRGAMVTCSDRKQSPRIKAPPICRGKSECYFGLWL